MKCISENEYVTVEDDKSKDLYVLWSWVGTLIKSEDRFSYAYPYDKTLLKNQEVRDIIENLARVTGGKGNK